MADSPPLILASTSPYRRELLQRLRLPFQVEAPEVDETPQPGEAPRALAQRLAIAKASFVARRHAQAIVIGSDQVADLQGLPIGKPGTHAVATLQLRAMSGQRVLFHTAVAVVHAAANIKDDALVTVAVRFRTLNDGVIERYLALEKPYDCAGSAKVEALGIALIDSIESDDPTALIGLPLIRTCALLRRAGLDPLQ